MSDAADVSESIRACMQDMALTIQRQKAVIDAARHIVYVDGSDLVALTEAVEALDGAQEGEL